MKAGRVLQPARVPVYFCLLPSTFTYPSPTPADTLIMPPHTCEHCRKVVLRVPPLHAGGRRKVTTTECDLEEIERAVNDRCVLFVAMVSAFTLDWPPLERLEPKPLIIQTWLHDTQYLGDRVYLGLGGARRRSLQTLMGGRDVSAPFSRGWPRKWYRSTFLRVWLLYPILTGMPRE